jgi:polar amino acid transport system substrate-binding protein
VRYPFVAAVLLALTVACASAQEVTLYLMEVPPYAMDAPQQKGMVGDVVLEALRRAGYQTRLVVVPSPRALSAVPGMQDTLIIPLARTKDRETHYTWIAHILNVERAFFTLDRKVTSFAEAKAAFKSIGVARASAGYPILLEQGFDADQIQVLNQGVSAVRMLQSHRIDAWYNPVLEAELLQREAGVPSSFAMSPTLGPTEQYLGCSRKCDPKLVASLSAAIKAMQRDGTVQKMIAHYLAP